MQYIPCNSALLAQKTLFLTQEGTVFQIYKSFGIWEDPPPHVGKNSQIISFFLFDSVPNHCLADYDLRVARSQLQILRTRCFNA